MLVIAGKTASGKDTIAERLVSDYGFRRIVTYTTRPMRKNEKQDVSYHFISVDEFQEKKEAGFFAEYKTYDTTAGLWYYGTSFEDLASADYETLIILTPDGLHNIKKNDSLDIKTAYVYANNKTIKQRLLKRGDDKNEAERRVQHDNEDFKGFEEVADRIFYNNYDDNIEDVVKRIAEWCRKSE